MKNFTPFLSLCLMLSTHGIAQPGQLVPDQNPQYLQSQNKYVVTKDSINQWHATTLQNTYKAYDFFEAKAEKKAEHRTFKRNLRLERARRVRYYSNFDPYYNNSFYSPYNNWNYRPYRRGYRW